ncbi:MAG: NlpC/P60 family protein [Pseudomonadota bacterium]
MTPLPPDNWSHKYVGIPYADRGRDEGGADCWGLACLVYAAELAVALPSYLSGYVSADEREEIARLIDHRREAEGWHAVIEPQPFDLILFRRGTLGSHVGIHERPGHMLHMDGEDAAKVVRLDDPRWSIRRVGSYRLNRFRGGV